MTSIEQQDIGRDLAERIDADPTQSSRYENGCITPSADAIIRLAETFNVSCDSLLVDNAPRRAFTSPEDDLGPQLHHLTELDPDDLELITRFIDALVTKPRLENLTNTIN